MNDCDNDDRGPQVISEVWMDLLLKRAVFRPSLCLYISPRRSGKLQPVMTEQRQCSNGGRYPLEDDGEEDDQEFQGFRGWYGEHAGDVWQRCASVERNAYLLPGEHAPQSDATDFLASTQGAPDLEPPVAAQTLESLVDMVNTNVFSAA